MGLNYKECEIKINKSWLWLPFSILVLSRLIPFFRWGEFPLAADAGVYIENFRPYVSIPVIYTIHILLNLLAGFGIYEVTKKYFNEKAAFFSLLIFSLSISQFLVYWVFYAKMTAAIALTLFAANLIQKKSWQLIPIAILIGFFHPLTLLPFLLTILLFSIFEKNRFFLLVSFFSVLVSSFFINWDKFWGYVYYAEKYLRGDYARGISEILAGNFVQLDFYQNFLALIYLPFAILGFIRLVYNKKFTFLFYYALVNFSFVYLNFIFHNRFIILLDIIFIILAGEVLLNFLQIFWTNKLMRIIFTIILVVLIGNIAYQSWVMEPIINNKELEEIKLFSKTENGIPVASSDTRYIHVLKGYGGHPIVNLEEISNKEVYIYMGRRGPELDLKQLGFFKKISEHFWRGEVIPNNDIDN